MRLVRSAVWIGLGTVSVFVVLSLFLIVRGNNTASFTPPEGMSIAEVNYASYLPREDDELVFEEVTPTTPKWPSTDVVWEECVLKEFPWDEEAAVAFVKDLELSEDCIAALEGHILSINPFTRRDRYVNSLSELGYKGYEFSLIVLNNPMTYERIFSDPIRDRDRVIDALSRPECRLETSIEDLRESLYYQNSEPLDLIESHKIPALVEKDELKPSCHADAFTNYAAFYDACNLDSAGLYFSKHRDYFTSYRSKPERINQMWQGYLEQRWIDEKCKEFDSVLQLDSYPDQFELLLGIYRQELSDSSRRDREQLHKIRPDIAAMINERAIYNSLLTLGARLGDQAASLTYRGMFRVEGSFRRSLGTSTWKELQQDKELSKERLRQAVDLVVDLEKESVNFDWEWLVRHVCSPDRSTTDKASETQEPPSCRSLINDLRIDFSPSYRLEVSQLTAEEIRQLVAKYARQAVPVNQQARRFEILDKFEHIAIELDVYK